MEKMTQKQFFALGLVALEDNGINAYVAIEKYATQLKNNNIDTQKINSINATFASLASKGLVEKDKRVYNDRLVTFYTITEKGLANLNKEEEND